MAKYITMNILPIDVVFFANFIVISTIRGEHVLAK